MALARSLPLHHDGITGEPQRSFFAGIVQGLAGRAE
jgi:hypothetical protein